MEYNTTPYGQLLHRFVGQVNGETIPSGGELKLNQNTIVEALPNRRQSLFSITETGAFIMDNVSLVSFYLRIRIFPDSTSKQLPYRISLVREVDNSVIHNTTVIDTLNLGGPTTNSTVFTFSEGMNDPYNVVGGGFNLHMYSEGNQGITLQGNVQIDIFSTDYGE